MDGSGSDAPHHDFGCPASVTHNEGPFPFRALAGLEEKLIAAFPRRGRVLPRHGEIDAIQSFPHLARGGPHPHDDEGRRKPEHRPRERHQRPLPRFAEARPEAGGMKPPIVY